MTIQEERAVLDAAINIRPFEATDYEVLAAVRNAIRVEHPSSAEELQVGDEQLKGDPRFKQGRWLAYRGGDLVGYAEHYQNPGMYHPRRFTIDGGVLEEHWGLGVGRALYATLLAGLAPLDPLSLRVAAREDHERSVRFLGDRGFREDKRYWESTLDVNSFDSSAFADLEERLVSEGITIKTVEELSHSDEGWREKYHELFCTVRVDVPRTEPASEITFEQFVEWVIEDPVTLLDASFIALDGDRFVGMSDLYRSESSPGLFVGLTAVRREYRKRGIATALKLRGIDYARSKGVRVIRTNNASTNRPMLSLNEKFGFAKEPVWISFLKEFGQE